MLRICTLDSLEGNCNECGGTGLCPTCGGSGEHLHLKDVECPTCYGDKECVFRNNPQKAIT